ncbi:hypothetical protein [Nocardia otitidiscaviarum]|uniref:hypothetical protein n=1 Tax=Nocardia otitidiscaviarum TaxID=1823 RepID=UPI001894DAB0|nr:hypothetical protein [Nocardia otitidiscaviarum]MBF6181323.1 hypothetical protein [Nocardia otitidiscaviarum]
MKRSTFGGLAVAVASAAAPVLLAPTASADTENIRVDARVSGETCSTSGGCVIRIRTVGKNRLDEVAVTVNGTVVGYAWPVQDQWDPNRGSAEVVWNPSESGSYHIVAKQGVSSGVITYDIQSPGGTGSFGGLLPSGSAG